MAATLFGTPSYGGSSAASTTPANPFSTISNTKSTSVDKRLTDLLDQFDALRTAGTSALSSYTSALGAATPKMTSFVNADINTLGNIANGTTDAELAAIRGRRQSAIQQSVSRAKGDLSRVLGLNQLGMGGGGRALGSSSYLQKLGLDKTADIYAKAAADNADQERADYGYTTGMKLGTLGQRGNYLDALAGRSLLPFAQGSAQYNQQLQQLRQLLAANLQNNFYGLQKPFNSDIQQPTTLF